MGFRNLIKSKELDLLTWSSEASLNLRSSICLHGFQKPHALQGVRFATMVLKTLMQFRELDFITWFSQASRNPGNSMCEHGFHKNFMKSWELDL